MLATSEKIRQSESTFRRIQAFVKKLKPGQEISYLANYNRYRERKQKIKNKGRILKITEHYILVQTQNYRECINIIDFLTGDVKIVLG